ncbi:MAG: DUF3137 domain-containing protein [Clostridiales bacterium]|nr:DUF3137 domain-containing protein [Clostridiales bacterium]
MKENVQTTALNDAEIQARLNVMRKSANARLLAFFILLGACCGLGVWAGIAQKNGEDVPQVIVWGILALFFAAVVLFFMLVGKKNKIKAFVSENITRGLLGEVFEVEEYNHGAHISADLIRGAGLTGQWDKCTGSDLVRGKYKGRTILFSDVKLERAERRKNSDGDTETDWVTVFQGPWIFVEHDRRLAATLRLREKPPLFSAKMTSDIETENAAFNSRFQILTSDWHTAFLILTPHFMEFIASADARAGGLTNMCFNGNLICIAVQNNRDSFEASGKQLKDINLLRADQRREITYLTDILDELMRNDDLFGGKNPDGDVSRGFDIQDDAEASVTDDAARAGQKPAGRKKTGILRRFNPIGLILLAIYAVSALYTLIRLPYGIILSTDIFSPDAVSAPTLVYILVLTIFVLGFMWPLLTLRRRGGIGGLFTGIAGTALLLLFHYLFVAANLGG